MKDDYSRVPLVTGDDSDLDTELFNQKQLQNTQRKREFKNKLQLICVTLGIVLLIVVTASILYMYIRSAKKAKEPSYIGNSSSETLSHSGNISPNVHNNRQSTVYSGHTTKGKPTRTYPQTNDWTVHFEDIGSESVIRLVDIDGDGRQDIIFGGARAVDLNKIAEVSHFGDLEQYCHKMGLSYPCLGILYGLRGYDGKILWTTKVRSGTILLNCVDFDINKDGIKDCIITGRQALIEAIDITTGKHIWTGNRTEFMEAWNNYQVMALPDFNNDGINEILIMHGGDPNFDADELARVPSRLMMLNGATGEKIGRHLEMPHQKESYQSPVLYTAEDGSQYILLGSGGETVAGDFMMLSVPDYYRYVMNLPQDAHVPKVRGSYRQWPHLFRAPGTGLITLYRGENKGVMVPPLTTDVNKDGVDDIVMSAYDGLIILYDGKTMERIWTARFPGCESYSTPAPGFFNDDDTLDFMVHWSYGFWPYYNASQKVIIDGRDGSIMWRMNMKNYEMASDLTVQTYEKNRDIYVYKTKGRGAKFYTDITGEVHGVGAQRKILVNETSSKELNKEKKRHGNEEIEPDHPESLTSEEIYEDFRKHHFSCDSDIDIKSEAFLMDRTLLDTPIKIMESGVIRQKYYPVNELTLKENKTQKFCSVLQPEDRSTASLGDVDGDGTLDFVTLLAHAGEKVTTGYSYDSMFYRFSIIKKNLEPLLKDMSKRTKVKVTTTMKKDDFKNEKSIEQLRLLPKDEQQWLTYFGTNENGHYDNKPRR